MTTYTRQFEEEVKQVVLSKLSVQLKKESGFYSSDFFELKLLWDGEEFQTIYLDT